MRRCAPEEMEKAGVPPMGSYLKHNGHGGVIWGYKREVPLTEKSVKRIMFACIRSNKVTLNCLKSIRKAFSYAYQLQMGVKASPGKECNYKCMPVVWNTIDEHKLPQSMRASTLPTRIPTVKELGRAFNTEWTFESPLSLMAHTDGNIMAYDSFICGPRGNEDIARIKKSKECVIQVTAMLT